MHRTYLVESQYNGAPIGSLQGAGTGRSRHGIAEDRRAQRASVHGFDNRTGINSQVSRINENVRLGHDALELLFYPNVTHQSSHRIVVGNWDEEST